MVQAIIEALLPAALDRAVLLANHVLSGEPAAVERLRAHAGRVVRVEALDWPSFLPPWPVVEVRLTPAGLLERPEATQPGSEPDLHLGVQAARPLELAWALASGERPAIQVRGDAALAAAVQEVAERVRWDAMGDLERAIGVGPARALAGLVSALVGSLRPREGTR